MNVIIFPQDDNKVSLVIPVPEYADQIEAIAAKDVPSGKPWRIVDDSELPSREVRDLWRWTESGPLDVTEPEPTPVPNLTFPQLLFGLVTEGFITEQEGNDWLVGRTLPAGIEAAISQLPGPQQLLARARALQPTEVIFSDPMVQMMGAAQGKTQDEMAAFFRAYAGV